MIIKRIVKEVKLSKQGKPYASISLQFDEYNDGKGNLKWIRGFGNRYTWAWKVGDDVQPEITENDRGYLNFSFRDEKENALNVYGLPATVGFVLELLKDKTQAPAPQAPVSDDINPEDIPF